MNLRSITVAALFLMGFAAAAADDFTNMNIQCQGSVTTEYTGFERREVNSFYVKPGLGTSGILAPGGITNMAVDQSLEAGFGEAAFKKTFDETTAAQKYKNAFGFAISRKLETANILEFTVISLKDGRYKVQTFSRDFHKENEGIAISTDFARLFCQLTSRTAR